MLALARDVIEAKKQVDLDEESDYAKEALTELFTLLSPPARPAELLNLGPDGSRSNRGGGRER